MSFAYMRNRISIDPGLNAHVSDAEINRGLAAVDSLSEILTTVINRLGVNRDQLLTEADLKAVSNAIRAVPADYQRFVTAHGDDEGDSETGYHLLQNDGGSLMFQGRKFLDTVVDAIFHTGFTYSAGRFVNEDGDANETVADVAGWLNYFVNGVNAVYGSAGADQLGSGAYSPALAAAASETFYAGEGNDSIWADVGDDTVWCGVGHDKTGGGEGNDSLHGEAGRDTLYGETGDDLALGGTGHDVIGLGAGNDSAFGGADNDTLYGEAGDDSLAGESGDDLAYAGLGDDRLEGGDGADTLAGDEGHDRVYGGAGGDKLYGGAAGDVLHGDAGNDTISGGEGADVIAGDGGADSITLWETTQSRDTLVFRAGDSGKTRATIDTVEGFDSGTDKIDLRSFDGMVFADLDYRGGGVASCYHDGRHLRIDGNGDGVTDMIIAFKWVNELTAQDFLFA